MTTAVQVQYRRGTATQVAAFTGAQGELTVDTTNNRLVVQDGATAGGFPAAKLSEVLTAVAANGGNVVTQAGSIVTIAEPGGYLNKFRNGTMDVWQRGTSSLTATTAGAYTADGWIVLPSGASVTAAQAGGRLLTKSSLQITGASSVTDVIVKQRIESYIAAVFCSQAVTIQAQIYNNTGASITPTLTIKHAGSQDVWSSPVADVSAANLQPCPNSQWTQVAYTFAASASSYNGVEVSFDFGNNFGTGTKSIQMTELDIRVTPGVAAGLNSNPPPPELRQIPIELAFCQRYFEKSYRMSAAPGSSWTLHQGDSTEVSGAAGLVLANVKYGCPKRVAPTITPYDRTGASGKGSVYVSAWADGDTPVTTTTDAGFCYYSTISNNVIVAFAWLASAEL